MNVLAVRPLVGFGLLLSGCVGSVSSKDVASPEAPQPAVPVWQAGVTQACDVTLSADAQPRLLVGGQLTEHRIGEDLELTVHPFDDHHVAFAVRPQWRPWFPRPESATLYTVGCEAPFEKQTLLTLEGADFGSSVLAPGGEALYFSGATAQRLDIATLTTQSVADATPWPQNPDCHGYESSARDVVSGWQDDTGSLVVHRYHPCGLDGYWQGDELVISQGAEGRVAKRTSPVATVATDQDGRIWLGDGGRCEAPGLQDPQTRGAVWRSDDAGASWTAVPFAPEAREPGEYTTATAATQISIGAESGQVLVVTAVCETNGVGAYGGLLYRTADGGESWTRIPVPEGFADIDVGDGVIDFELVKGDFNHIRAWPHRPDENDRVAYDTRDGGKTWVVNSNSPQGPARRATEVKVGGTTLRATAFGLMDGSRTVFRTLDQTRG